MNQVIVITGTTEEFEVWCRENNRDRNSAIQLRQPEQLNNYDEDIPIVFYGNYGGNPAYGSRLLNERLDKQVLNEIKQGKI